MDVRNILKKYRLKLLAEAVIKAAAFGAIFGFIALLGFAFAAWMTDFKQIWWGAIIFIGVTALFGLPAYFIKFRPNTKKIAQRIDSLGLEERILTMTEFENETSNIYNIQRAETISTLEENGITSKLIKIVLTVPLIVGIAVAGFFGAGMTTVSALSAAGVIEDGSSFFNRLAESDEAKEYEVIYLVSLGEGHIDGETVQKVKAGSSAMPVMAVAEDGYFFLNWSDGRTEPFRCDNGIKGSVTYYAVFTQIENVEEDIGDGDEPDDLPMDYEQAQEGSGDDPGDGNQTGGEYKDHNKVYDGETYYGGQVYNNAYKDAIERMAEEQGWTEEEKRLIIEYFKSIAA